MPECSSRASILYLPDAGGDSRLKHAGMTTLSLRLILSHLVFSIINDPMIQSLDPSAVTS